MKQKRAMVFGVFDLLHPGHLYLLYHARMMTKGGELIAAVARDASVKKLKGRMPEWNEKKRVRAVRMTGLATKVVLGDKKESDYAVIKKYAPDMICLGYDQSRLKKDLVSKIKSNNLPEITLYTMKPYKTKIFHTSIYRGKNKPKK